MRRQRGFTLPELLATVAVLAILASVAAPSFSGMIASQRAKGAAGDLFSSLLRTRSEAIKRNTEVTLAPVATGWKDGWNINHPTSTTVRLETHGAVTGSAITGPASVVFLPNGRVKGASAPAFDISVSGTPQHRCIQIDLSGRPYQKAGACPLPQT